MSVWDRLVGQEGVVKELASASAAAHGHAETVTSMTHAWLITGPPGSGRSVAAQAFAASLVCPTEGCGECPQCREVVAGSHPDVELVRSTTLSHSKQLSRELVAKAAVAPAISHWRCIVVEDADRMTEAAANTLLKAIEEPTERTVWILCAPSSEDLLPTIRSRTRHVALRIPEANAVAQVLQSEGVEEALAEFAARAAQGHIGRARALALEEDARSRRTMIMRIPTTMANIQDAYAAAHEMKATADADAKERLSKQAEKEEAETLQAYGEGATGVTSRKIKGYARGALSELAQRQQRQASRSTRDELDRYFTDLLSYFRDVLVLQKDASVDLVNPDVRPLIEQSAGKGSPMETVARLDAITKARLELEGNVPPALVCEALMIQILHPVP